MRGEPFGSNRGEREQFADRFRDWCERQGGNPDRTKSTGQDELVCDVDIAGDRGRIEVDFERMEGRGPQVMVQDMDREGPELRASGYAEDIFVQGRQLGVELEGDGYIRINP